MDKSNTQTSERPVSGLKSEIIKEAKRLEESLQYSSKGHFVAALRWKFYNFLIGMPLVVLSAISAISSFSQFDPNHIATGIISIIIAGLSGIMTLLNPNESSRNHLNSGNNYDSLQDNVRIFWSIDCWQEES